MLAILSPAKRMKTEDCLAPRTEPMFLARTEQLLGVLRGMTLPQLQTLLQCNDDIARRSWRQYQTMDLRAGLSPAVLSFDGIQYQYMAPGVFDDRCFDYIERHVRILSGFYGLLRPFDGVTPYRLEMQARLRTDFCTDLYDFWSDGPCRALLRETDTIVNLASGEYSRLIRRHLPKGARFVTCTFGEQQGGRVVEKGVYVKMARGEMVRFMAENHMQRPEELRSFDRLGFVFQPALSDESRLVFVAPPGQKRRS